MFNVAVGQLGDRYESFKSASRNDCIVVKSIAFPLLMARACRRPASDFLVLLFA
jgi:hypothetical protein